MSTLTTTTIPRISRAALRPQPFHHVRRSIAASTAAREVTIEESNEPNWTTFETRSISRQNFQDLLQNRIPDVRVRRFLSADECQSLVKIIKTHEIVSFPSAHRNNKLIRQQDKFTSYQGSYNEDVYPPIGSVGITQFDHANDKEGYFSKVKEARLLQERFRKEANIDVLSRVKDVLQRATGLPVRIAREDDREYFAGLIRLINKSALLHADYGPYDGPQWEIGRIAAQVTWNILLKQVDGGESVVYDRPWEGPSDNAQFKDPPPGYGYSHSAVEGRASKTMKYDEGDLHFFNSRNFHEVKALPSTAAESRYTMSSFVGLLPNFWPSQPGLILWS
ncbi:hypothetical protein SNOG_14103 [Paecilomyces variotii No. 5]|uniref:Prolyl 4-hydroxylase alpha subunit Fe(2+) 2OG dioxygenase domain-containing protein n=1 Tax=Byssochlamys spectabilis (strain No. 5 / NBRC 109023) TaxID=1356009 RepID=V5G247_BYSSN|nr:hypothetical protein SNOG_14103 [Paecilomyces variotii No. 5]